MAGKVLPYIIVGYIQLALIVTAARLIFHVPFEGSLILLLLSTLPFIAANLTVGITISTLASNQLQAVQMNSSFSCPLFCCLDLCFQWQECLRSFSGYLLRSLNSLFNYRARHYSQR